MSTDGSYNLPAVAVAPNGRINIANLPVFATDIDAGTGGLVAGDLYRAASGIISAKL